MAISSVVPLACRFPSSKQVFDYTLILCHSSTKEVTNSKTCKSKAIKRVFFCWELSKSGSLPKIHDGLFTSKLQSEMLMRIKSNYGQSILLHFFLSRDQKQNSHKKTHTTCVVGVTKKATLGQPDIYQSIYRTVFIGSKVRKKLGTQKSSELRTKNPKRSSNPPFSSTCEKWQPCGQMTEHGRSIRWAEPDRGVLLCALGLAERVGLLLSLLMMMMMMILLLLVQLDVFGG